MKTYFLDTNILLRFFLKDNLKQHNFAESYFLKAKSGLTNLVIIPQVIIETDYVLRKVYTLQKESVAEVLMTLVTIPYINLENKESVLAAINLFNTKNVDLVDAYLFSYAKSKGAKVLSFDKDFKKLK